MLPHARIYLANKKPGGQDVIKPNEERMFHASVDGRCSKGTPGYLSFNWYKRNVQVSPFAISTRILVERDSLTWTPPVGSLTVGVNLIEFEVTLHDVLTTRDFGFIKVEEPNLFAWISGGSGRLSSSNCSLHFDGSKSFDPELGKKQHLGMDFVWTCYDGGQAVNPFLRHKKIIMVAFDRTEANVVNCSSNLRFESNGTTAVIRHPLAQHVYYIELKVQKHMRRAKFLQTVYTSEKEIVEVFIR